MALDNLIEDKGGEVEENEQSLNIERLDRDKGFRIRVDFDSDDEDSDGKYLDTYLSPYVDDVPWTRGDLTNDIVDEAIHNILSEIKDENPTLTFKEATIREVTAVREIKPEENK